MRTTRKRMMVFPTDGEEEPYLCAACEEPIARGEEPYREGYKTYHGKCAGKWRCVNCGRWNDRATPNCVECGERR
jgi:hypothetical protein